MRLYYNRRHWKHKIFQKYARFLVISCTIIVVQSWSIETDFWRKPWVNTIAFYPLNSSTQLQDMSWNNRHLDYSSNVSRNTDDVYMNWSSSILRKTSSILTGDPIYTIARSFKVQAITTARKEFFSLMRDVNWYRWPLLSVRSSTLYLDYNWLVWWTFNFTVQAWKWYRAVLLHTASRVNTLYIDWVNIWTITMSQNQNLYWNQMHIWSEKDNTSVFYWNLKNYIFENVVRNEQQIADDYRYFPNS